jgi:hypothetical protein
MPTCPACERPDCSCPVTCKDCGRPLTHCFFPGDHVCLRVALNAARRGLAAWEAAAQYVADKGGCIDALRGVDGCDLFVSFDGDPSTGFEGTSCEKESFTVCVLDIAQKLKLIQEEK